MISAVQVLQEEVSDMNKFRHFYFPVFLVMMLAYTLPVFGQGMVKGIVVDAVTSDPLAGANVFIEGTAFGSSTDLDGIFIIPKIPFGTYNLHITYIGYLEKKLEIAVSSEKADILEIRLEAGIIEGEVITVTGQAEGQAAAINRQIQSSTITNVVSSERIQELPDVNAAESVGRLPGVSIKRSGGEANKVVIRGLAPTYNAITIAGERLPATDLSDRSVDLSMISPESIESIEVTKALTPDRDGDAFGGSVDFKLADAPDIGFNYDVRVQGGYNNLFSQFGNYKSNMKLSNRYWDGKIGLLITGNLEKTQRGSDQLEAGYKVLREKREGEAFAPIAIDELVLKDRYEDRKRYGASLILDYLLPAGRIVFNNFLSRLDRSQTIQYNDYSIDSNWHERKFREIESQVDILTNSLSGDYDFNLLKIDWRLSRSTSLQRVPFESYIRFKETSPFNIEDLPPQPNGDDLVRSAKNDYLNTHAYEGHFYNEKSWERDITGQLNLNLPYTISNQLAGYLKLGGKFRAKDRERDRTHLSRRLDTFRAQYELYHTQYGKPGFEYVYTEREGYASFLNYVDRGYDTGNFLDGQYDFGFASSKDELDHLLNAYMLDSLYFRSSYADLEDYEVQENVSAFYLMTELNVGQFLMFLPGFRYEYTRAEMTGRRGAVSDEFYEPDIDQPVVRDTSAVNTYENWLPMIHLRYKPTNWFDIRLAYTNSLSRPRLDWMMPKLRVLGTDQKVEMGKPDLKPQTAKNYDVFLSFYGGWVGLFTLGGFYKDIENLIYNRLNHKILDAAAEGFPVNLQGFSLDRPENNPFKTDVYGYEVEWQTNFRWLPSPFDGIVLYANYTHIYSETKFPRSIVKQEQIPVFPFVRTTVVDTFRTGNMPDQANDIANIAIGYDIGGFSGRVSMLYQGKTLTIVGTRPELDGYTESLWRWDLSIKQDISRHFSLYFNWNNISNWPDESFQKDTHYPTSREFYGWTADVGLRFRM